MTCQSKLKMCLLAASLTLLPTIHSPAQAPGPTTGGWIQLFNGKDLSDWTVKIKGYELGDNYADTFRVEDGVLRVGYEKYSGPFRGRFGHLFYNKPFSNYELRVEYRIVGTQYDRGPGWAIRIAGS